MEEIDGVRSMNCHLTVLLTLISKFYTQMYSAIDWILVEEIMYCNFILFSSLNRRYVTLNLLLDQIQEVYSTLLNRSIPVLHKLKSNQQEG